jgi:hypothetical protein
MGSRYTKESVRRRYLVVQSIKYTPFFACATAAAGSPRGAALVDVDHHCQSRFTLKKGEKVTVTNVNKRKSRVKCMLHKKVACHLSEKIGTLCSMLSSREVPIVSDRWHKICFYAPCTSHVICVC